MTPDTCILCNQPILPTDPRTLRVAIPRNAHGYRYTEQGQPHYTCYQSVMIAENELACWTQFFENNPQLKLGDEKEQR